MTDNLLETEDETLTQDKKAPESAAENGAENLLEEESAAAPIEKITIEGDKPSNIPSKFWDSESNAINVGAIAKSYEALERKMSSTMPKPESDEDRVQVMKMLGLPDSPDMYDVDVSHGLFDIDSDLNTKMFDKGFTTDQVQAVYDLAAEKFVPMVFEIAQEFQADREVERLVSTFGGAEKWQEVSRQLLTYGKKNLPEHVLDNLASSFEGVMALYRMMKGQEPGLEGDLAQIAGDKPEGGEDDLRGMMRDPRYWHDKDPAFVSKVTAAFEKKYAE